jgi:hypothetical protein
MQQLRVNTYIKQYSNSFLSENEAKMLVDLSKKPGPGFINVKQSKSYLSESRIKWHIIVNTIPELHMPFVFETMLFISKKKMKKSLYLLRPCLIY